MPAKRNLWRRLPLLILYTLAIPIFIPIAYVILFSPLILLLVILGAIMAVGDSLGATPKQVYLSVFTGILSGFTVFILLWTLRNVWTNVRRRLRALKAGWTRWTEGSRTLPIAWKEWIKDFRNRKDGQGDS